MNRPPNEELDRLDGAGDLEELIHRGFRGGVRSRLGKFHFCFYLLKCDWNGLPRVRTHPWRENFLTCEL
jgi:hypothetical protein